MYKLIATGIAAAMLTTPALAIDWDEGIDGDLSDDEFNGTFLALDVGNNIISGTIGGPAATSPPDDFFDAFVVGLDAGESISAIQLVSYTAAGGNTTSGFNVFDAADGFVNSVLIGPATVGTDIFPGIGAAILNDYTIGIREGTPGQQYSINIVVVPAPAATALLGLGAFIGLRRRR